MKTTGLIISLAALLAFPACGDDEDGDGNGNTDNPAFVSAFPAETFAGRTTMVALAGEDTSFSSASQIDFGPGVTVDGIMAAGSTSLIVEISVAPDAALGPRDITVDGLTLTGGISLASPIVSVIQGRVGQGGLAIVDIENLDFANPFDDTTDAEGNFTGTTATVPGGAGLVASVSETAINLTLAVEIDATPGDFNVEIVSGGMTSIVPVSISAFSPKPVPGPLATGTVANAFDTEVFELTAAELAGFSAFPATSDAADSDPVVFAIGSGGSFDTDFLGSASTGFFGPAPFTANLAAGEKIYLVVWNNAGAAGYNFAFETFVNPLTNTISDVEPNDTFETAQAVTLPGGVVDGTLASVDDQDFYSITIGEGDVGKRIAVTTARTLATETIDNTVEILDTDGVTVLAASADGGILDAVTGPAIAVEGTYFVRVFSAFEDENPAATFNTAIGLVDALPE